jgi:hypothetical protein
MATKNYYENRPCANCAAKQGRVGVVETLHEIYKTQNSDRAICTVCFADPNPTNAGNVYYTCKKYVSAMNILEHNKECRSHKHARKKGE